MRWTKMPAISAAFTLNVLVAGAYEYDKNDPAAGAGPHARMALNSR
jgi:hypothetical protein